MKPSWKAELIYTFLIMILTAMIVLLVSAAWSAVSEDEIPSPGVWISNKEAYGLHNLSSHQYNLIIMGLSSDWNIHITRSCNSSNSMAPAITYNNFLLWVTPDAFDCENLSIGDIILFYDDRGTSILHRIVECGYDSEGLFFRTKGDNNKRVDKEKVRPEAIKGVLVGVLY